MNMSYSKNPNLPKVRAEAVKLLRSGRSTREVARRFGYAHTTILRWNRKVHSELRQFQIIPTESSRPHSHPAELAPEIVKAIIGVHHKSGRGAEYIHYILTKRQSLSVSLSSVKRTLRRNELTKYSRRQYPPRSAPEAPGHLVQVDTVHRIYGSNRLYVYTLLDIYSPWYDGICPCGSAFRPANPSFRRKSNRKRSGHRRTFCRRPSANRRPVPETISPSESSQLKPLESGTGSDLAEFSIGEATEGILKPQKRIITE